MEWTWNDLGKFFENKEIDFHKNKCCGNIPNTLLNIPIHTKIWKFLMKITLFLLINLPIDQKFDFWHSESSCPYKLFFPSVFSTVCPSYLAYTETFQILLSHTSMMWFFILRVSNVQRESLKLHISCNCNKSPVSSKVFFKQNALEKFLYWCLPYKE